MMSGTLENENLMIVAPGSSGVRLTDREDQIARLLSLGYSHKQIGRHVRITTGAVSAHVTRIASRIPGNGNPTVKLTVWYLQNRG